MTKREKERERERKKESLAIKRAVYLKELYLKDTKRAWN